MEAGGTPSHLRRFAETTPRDEILSRKGPSLLCLSPPSPLSLSLSRARAHVRHAIGQCRRRHPPRQIQRLEVQPPRVHCRPDRLSPSIFVARASEIEIFLAGSRHRRIHPSRLWLLSSSSLLPDPVLLIIAGLIPCQIELGFVAIARKLVKFELAFAISDENISLGVITGHTSSRSDDIITRATALPSLPPKQLLEPS